MLKNLRFLTLLTRSVAEFSTEPQRSVASIPPITAIDTRLNPTFIRNSFTEAFSHSTLPRETVATNPSHIQNPTAAPSANLEGSAMLIINARTNAMTSVATNWIACDFPAPFFISFVCFAVKPLSLDHFFPNTKGEYHTIPIAVDTTAATSTAQRFTPSAFIYNHLNS